MFCKIAFCIFFVIKYDRRQKGRKKKTKEGKERKKEKD